MDEKKFVGKRICERRKDIHMTQEQLAAKTSLSAGYIGQLERGEKNFTFDCLLKITSELKLPLEDLFWGICDTSDERSDARKGYDILIELSPNDQHSAYEMLKIYSEKGKS